MKPMCAMVEYASMRLRLVCAIAVMLPIASDSTASSTSICCQSIAQRAAGRHQQAQRHGERGELRAPADEQRHRGRRALVDVRHPHVERHHAELEGDAGHDEHQAEHQHASVLRRRGDRRRDLVRSSEPVAP